MADYFAGLFDKLGSNEPLPQCAQDGEVYVLEVEGGIGVGKSRFISWLFAFLQGLAFAGMLPFYPVVCTEPVDYWNNVPVELVPGMSKRPMKFLELLRLTYEMPGKHRVNAQLIMLTSSIIRYLRMSHVEHFEKAKGLPLLLIMERSYKASEVFVSASANLFYDEVSATAYRHYFKMLSYFVKKEGYMVLGRVILEAPIKVLSERIALRDRKSEKGIVDAAYLKALDKASKAALYPGGSGYDGVPTYIFDNSDSFGSQPNPTHFADIIQFVLQRCAAVRGPQLPLELGAGDSTSASQPDDVGASGSQGAETPERCAKPQVSDPYAGEELPFTPY